MEETLLNWAIGMAMANPAVAAVVGTAAGIMVIGYTVARTSESIGVLLRPFVKLTRTKKDDKWLEVGIWWLDAFADVVEPLSVFKWKRAWSRTVEVWEDNEFRLTGSGFVQADVGSQAFAVDNFVISKVANVNTLVGSFTLFISATEMVVKIDGGLRAKPAAYTVTSWNADRTFDADAALITEINDVVGTLIQDLVDLGILNGTTAA